MQLPYWQIWEHKKRIGAQSNDTFYCTRCKLKGCFPFGGVQGSLIYCEDCFYQNGCMKEEIKHHLVCCCSDPVSLYQPIKKRSKRSMKRKRGRR